MSGKVVFSDDKNPLSHGEVGFESASGTFFARGDIQPDGTFVVGSLKTNDGLPPGKYRVSVSAVQQVGQDRAGYAIFESLIDTKYGTPATSGLTLDITKTTRNFNIEVDRRAAAPPKANR